MLIITEFVAAYNLLVHLVRSSSNLGQFLPRMCRNLAQPITSSPLHGPGLALTVLTTIFNILPQDDEIRYNVFSAVLGVVKSTGAFESLRHQLRSLDSWIALWETDEEDQRRLFLSISDAANQSGTPEESYIYLVRALRTFVGDEIDGEEAQELSIRALKTALSDSTHFDFQDLTSVDTVQALRRTDSTLFELLEIFNAEQLEEYNDFKDAHSGWIEGQGLDVGVLDRKMRLLTLASTAAASQSRSLHYSHIAKALQVPTEDVELWVIDVIRAGLVEGKLSQLNQTLLIHRSTYRVFGEKQWSEVSGRLDTWKSSLENVLTVVQAEREKVMREKEREVKEMELKTGNINARRAARDTVAFPD